MQASTDLIGAFVKLTSGMEHCHNNLKCTLMEFLVLVNGNTTSVVFHRDGIILIDCHFNVGAESCHRLIDGVVHRFVYQVMEAFLTNVSDIHCRALAHCLQALKNLNITGGVVASVVLIFCHFCLFRIITCKYTKNYRNGEIKSTKKCIRNSTMETRKEQKKAALTAECGFCSYLTLTRIIRALRCVRRGLT